MTFEFDMEEELAAKLKVVGVGGAGGNAVNRMIEAGLTGVDFTVVNTDAQVLEQSRANCRIQIGDKVTRGLGAGADPNIGRRAIEEDRDLVSAALSGADMVFVTAGLGGGTGTGAAPVIAELAKQQGALTVAIVTLPFDFEGKPRATRALEGMEELREKVDTLICIRNQRLLAIVDRTTRLTDAFCVCDEILHQATKGIADLITVPGLINCDFADVRTVMREMGDAIMGTGRADGEGKAKEAARAAIHSPLLEDVSIVGARGVLVNITGGLDLALHDVHEATTIISEAAGEDANVIFGAVIDPRLDDEIRVTVIATGFGSGPRVTRSAPESKIESLSVPRVRVSGPAIDLFGNESSLQGKNRLSGLNMGESAVLSQPNCGDEDSDDLEVPAFVRKHLVHSTTEEDAPEEE